MSLFVTTQSASRYKSVNVTPGLGRLSTLALFLKKLASVCLAISGY
jgi:hypothetical protein